MVDIQNQNNNHQHLKRRFKFPPIICRNYNAVIGRYQAKSADDKLSADNDNHDPGSKLSRLDQTDHGRADQKFICQRIHKLAEIRHQIILSGYFPVCKIGQACPDKNHCRNIISISLKSRIQ